MKKHLSWRQIVIQLALIAAPLCALAEDYGITIGDVAVTSENARAVTGPGIEGTVSFNAETNTLTLSDATVPCIANHCEGLTIQLKGSNRVWMLPSSWVEAAPQTGAIQSEGSLTIGGEGTLHVFHARFPEADEANCAIAVTGGALTIEGGCLVEAYSPKGVGVSVEGDLTVRESRLQAGGPFAVGIQAAKTMLDGCVLHTPEGGSVAVVGPEDDNPEAAGVVLTDIPLTAYNAHAFQSPYRQKGSVDYDPDRNVLTLDGFQTLTDENDLLKSVRPLAFSHLTLKLIGESSFYSSEGQINGKSLAVEGNGELKVDGVQFSLLMDKLTLSDGCTFRAPYAPQGFVYIDSLVINSSTYIESEIAEQRIKYYELNNSRVVAPTWLTYDATLHQLVFVEGRDTSGDPFLHIAPAEATAITEVGADTGDSDLWHDINGRRIAHPSQGGIYIHQGKKIVVPQQ